MSVDFELSEDQVSLAELIGLIVAGRFPLERVRRAEEGRQVVDADDWSALGEAGVFSVTLAESAGGIGLGLADAAVVFEVLGRGLVPGPLVASQLAAALRGADGAPAVPGAADGTAIVGALMAPLPGDPGPVLVEHLDSLAALVVVGADGRPSVVDGDALDALRRDARPVERSLDPLTPLSVLASVPVGRPVEGGDSWGRDWRVLTGALCAGMAEACGDAAVAYAKARHQFTRPIGSFQAVKHLLADMLVRTEAARAAVQAAAVTADQPEVGDAERLAAGAALLATEAAVANAKASIQIHGGMGFTWEMPTHLYLMRARVLASSLGPPDALAGVVADRF